MLFISGSPSPYCSAADSEHRYSTALYAVPRTAFVGAILLTGYLGGAVATQVRVEDPWFLFPAFIGVLVWGGLFLRDGRVRALVLE
jgi:hypothetical protein